MVPELQLKLVEALFNKNLSEDAYEMLTTCEQLCMYDDSLQGRLWICLLAAAAAAAGAAEFLVMVKKKDAQSFVAFGEATHRQWPFRIVCI